MRKVNEEGTESGRRQLCKMPLAQGAVRIFIYKNLQNTRATTIGTMLCAAGLSERSLISVFTVSHMFMLGFSLSLILSQISRQSVYSLANASYQTKSARLAAIYRNNRRKAAADNNWGMIHAKMKS